MEPGYVSYIPKIEAPIKLRWQATKRPSCVNNFCASIKFKIFRNGQIADIKVLQRENESVAAKAIACIEKCKPFEKLPYDQHDFPPDISVKVTFLGDGDVTCAFLDNGQKK